MESSSRGNNKMVNCSMPMGGVEKVANKTCVLHIRLTEEERDAWQAAADADERTISQWIRYIVNNSLKGDKDA